MQRPRIWAPCQRQLQWDGIWREQKGRPQWGDGLFGQKRWGSILRFCFAEAHDTVPFLPIAAFAEQGDAFKTL